MIFTIRKQKKKKKMIFDLKTKRFVKKCDLCVEDRIVIRFCKENGSSIRNYKIFSSKIDLRPKIFKEN